MSPDSVSPALSGGPICDLNHWNRYVLKRRQSTGSVDTKKRNPFEEKHRLNFENGVTSTMFVVINLKLLLCISGCLASFQVNLGWPVPLQFCSSTCFRREPLRIGGTCFRPDAQS